MRSSTDDTERLTRFPICEAGIRAFSLRQARISLSVVSTKKSSFQLAQSRLKQGGGVRIFQSERLRHSGAGASAVKAV